MVFLHIHFSIRLLKIPRKKRHTRTNFLIKLQIVMDWGNMKLFSYYFTVVSSAIFPQGIMAQQVDSSCLLLLLLLHASGSSIVFFQGYLSKELCNEKKNEIRCTSKKIVMIAIFQNEMALKIIAKNIVIAPFIFSNFMKMNCIFV